MEVRIKDNNGYVDADWTIEGGIMIVSPKVEKYMYKEGDVIIVRSLYKHILIYKESTKGYLYSFADLIDDLLDIDKSPVCREDEIKEIRYATEKEKQKLFDKLKEEGYEWDTEKKEVVKIKWKPSYNGEYYFKPRLDMGQFIAHKTKWLNDEADNAYDKKGWIFKTNKECREFCYKLNQAIEGVKP